jgi:hypothetical protein
MENRSRFYLVKAREVPIEDPIESALVECVKLRFIRYLEARDKVWARGKKCSPKLQGTIEFMDKYLLAYGYFQMEDMRPEEQQMINDHFWELV